MILDLFAGPGGVDIGARMVGFETFGIEWDTTACHTRIAAGLWTLKGDVSALDPASVMGGGKIDMLWASPPCQAFSAAGLGLGHHDLPLIRLVAKALLKGNDYRARAVRLCKDKRSLLVVEPLRWALALRDSIELIALEQVPPVLELWNEFAEFLRVLGFSVWTGILNCADFGVPQTRRRAVLLASKRGTVHPPAATHSEHGGFWTKKWLSMAEALGWGDTPVTIRVRAEHSKARVKKFSSSSSSSWTLTNSARSWTRELHTNRAQREDGSRQVIPCSAPAPALTTKSGGQWKTKPAKTIAGNRLPRWCYDSPAKTLVTSRRSDKGIVVGRQLPEGEERDPEHGGWTLRASTREETAARARSIEEPAPALFFGARLNDVSWCFQRPAMTVVGSFSPDIVGKPGHQKWEGKNHRQTDGVRITQEEAAILQSFPADYPFQGTRTKRFEQIGNAVPPFLAAHIIATLQGVPERLQFLLDGDAA